MSQHTDTMKQAVALAEVCREGLEEIKSQLNKGQMEQTMAYFNHISNSFYDILQYTLPVLEKIPSKELEPLSKSLHHALGLAVQAYEQKDQSKVLEIMQFTLIPAYKKWQAELNNCFQRYLEPQADPN